MVHQINYMKSQFYITMIYCLWTHFSLKLSNHKLSHLLQIKCSQYFPMGSECGDQDEMIFEEVALRVTFLAETDNSYYAVRTLELTDLRVCICFCK